MKRLPLALYSVLLVAGCSRDATVGQAFVYGSDGAITGTKDISVLLKMKAFIFSAQKAGEPGFSLSFRNGTVDLCTAQAADGWCSTLALKAFTPPSGLDCIQSDLGSTRHSARAMVVKLTICQLDTSTPWFNGATLPAGTPIASIVMGDPSTHQNLEERTSAFSLTTKDPNGSDGPLGVATPAAEVANGHSHPAAIEAGNPGNRDSAVSNPAPTREAAVANCRASLEANKGQQGLSAMTDFQDCIQKTFFLESGKLPSDSRGDFASPPQSTVVVPTEVEDGDLVQHVDQAAIDLAENGGQPIVEPVGATSQQPAGGASQYAVQLSATAVEAEANALRDRARDNGFDSFVRPVATSGGVRYVVRVGPVPARSEAGELMKAVNEKLALHGLIVRDP